MPRTHTHRAERALLELEREAWDPTTPPRKLTRLSTYPHPWVRQGVAENDSADISSVLNLALDVEHDVRVAARANLNRRGIRTRTVQSA